MTDSRYVSLGKTLDYAPQDALILDSWDIAKSLQKQILAHAASKDFGISFEFPSNFPESGPSPISVVTQENFSTEVYILESIAAMGNVLYGSYARPGQDCSFVAYLRIGDSLEDLIGRLVRATDLIVVANERYRQLLRKEKEDKIDGILANLETDPNNPKTPY